MLFKSHDGTLQLQKWNKKNQLTALWLCEIEWNKEDDQSVSRHKKKTSKKELKSNTRVEGHPTLQEPI